MSPRIFLVHPTPTTMPPLKRVFTRDWPEARVFDLLDESLYADMDAVGTITPTIREKVRLLFDYCETAGADAVLFTGSTFGPAVDEARRDRRIPILKPDEAMADAAVAAGRRIAVLCTARRALPVIRAGLKAAAAANGAAVEIEEHAVAGAQAALAAGAPEEHERLIMEAAGSCAGADVLVLGQISMSPCENAVAAAFAGPVLSSPAAAAARLKHILSARGGDIR